MDEYVVNSPFEASELANNRTVKWNNRYLDMARLIGSWSKDPSSKIGAVAVGEDGQILSAGYNGFPRRLADLGHRLDDRETKYKYVVHAEMNIVYNASLNGISLKGSTVYVDGLPCCSECAKGLIQAGISRVVVRLTDIKKSDKWRESWLLSHHMFTEAGVTVEIMDEDPQRG